MRSFPCNRKHAYSLSPIEVCCPSPLSGNSLPSAAQTFTWLGLNCPPFSLIQFLSTHMDIAAASPGVDIFSPKTFSSTTISLPSSFCGPHTSSLQAQTLPRFPPGVIMLELNFELVALRSHLLPLPMSHRGVLLHVSLLLCVVSSHISVFLVKIALYVRMASFILFYGKLWAPVPDSCTSVTLSYRIIFWKDTNLDTTLTTVSNFPIASPAYSLSLAWGSALDLINKISSTTGLCIGDEGTSDIYQGSSRLEQLI